MGMFYLTHNSKASSEKLPNNREDEAKVSGDARFQEHDLAISTRRIFPITSSLCSSKEWLKSVPALLVICQSKDSERISLQPTRIFKDSLGFPLTTYPFWFHGLKHTHTTSGLHGPHLIPRASSQRSLRARTSEILRNKKVFHSLPNSGGLILQGHQSGKRKPPFRTSEVGFWW